MSAPKRVFLVSCVAGKKEMPSPAAELYTSTWFVMARGLAQMSNATWFILSAEHGLVAPDSVIAPYNRTLNTMRIADRRSWASRTLQQMEEQLPDVDEVVVLAGIRYREFLMPWLLRRFASVRIPMEGLPIGRQLSWMKHETGF